MSYATLFFFDLKFYFLSMQHWLRPLVYSVFRNWTLIVPIFSIYYLLFQRFYGASTCNTHFVRSSYTDT